MFFNKFFNFFFDFLVIIVFLLFFFGGVGKIRLAWNIINRISNKDKTEISNFFSSTVNGVILKGRFL